jgi:branched-chain amino acid transport system ATP-binding protein
VLREVTLEAHPGEAIAVIGPNGAGKTTLLKTIAGMLKPARGRVHYAGRPLAGLRAFEVARLGLVYVPAERELFPTMSVLENLELGAFRNASSAMLQLEYVFGLFPRLEERVRQLAGTLSGGEQQMLAIGRALMSAPKVLMLDEPSTGLAPKAVAELYRNLSKLKDAGLTLVLTEQQVPLALSLTERAYVLEQGSIRLAGPSRELLGNPEIKKAYLGVA